MLGGGVLEGLDVCQGDARLGLLTSFLLRASSTDVNSISLAVILSVSHPSGLYARLVVDMLLRAANLLSNTPIWITMVGPMVLRGIGTPISVVFLSSCRYSYSFCWRLCSSVRYCSALIEMIGLNQEKNALLLGGCWGMFQLHRLSLPVQRWCCHRVYDGLNIRISTTLVICPQLDVEASWHPSG